MTDYKVIVGKSTVPGGTPRRGRAPVQGMLGGRGVGVGFPLQVAAQRHTPAADAAILLSCETLFAALAGRFVLGETLTAEQMAGGLLIFACVLAVQILPLGRARRTVAAETG